jgi:hypothetical protein
VIGRLSDRVIEMGISDVMQDFEMVAVGHFLLFFESLNPPIAQSPNSRREDKFRSL